MHPRDVLRFAVLFAVVAAGPIGAVGVSTAALDSPIEAQSVSNSVAESDVSSQRETNTASSDSDKTLEIRYEVDAFPEQTGFVKVTLTTNMPSSVSKLELDLNPNQSVTSDVGFRRTDADENVWTWSNGGNDPRITYLAKLNRSNGRAAAGGFEEVDTGRWVLTSHRPQTVGVKYKYWYRGSDVRSTERIVPSSTGFGGANLLFLGDHQTASLTANGQTFRLVIPDAAAMEASPEQVFGSLAYASKSIRFGERDEVVNVFVAPAPIRRGGGTWWFSTERQQDIWVNEKERVDTPQNTWVHEYVHTRRGYTASESMEWIDEANAEYYAGLVSLNAGNASFDQFHNHVVAEKYEGDVLTRPDSWSSRHVEYRKGTQVLAALDAKIRRATDGERTLQNVFQRMNRYDDTITFDAFADIVAAVAGERFDDWLNKYVRTEASPSVSSDQHRFVLGSAVDADDDGLSNDEETQLGTMPFQVDSDGDSLSDGAEANDHGTDPTKADTDGDGVVDGAEVNERKIDPTKADSDGDGLGDGEEVELGTDPTKVDSDGDGLADAREANELETDPTVADTDDDGVTDSAELGRFGTSPTAADTDGDGLSDKGEIERGTNPTTGDTDGDGIEDGREVEIGTDATVETGTVEHYWNLVIKQVPGLFA